MWALGAAAGTSAAAMHRPIGRRLPPGPPRRSPEVLGENPGEIRGATDETVTAPHQGGAQETAWWRGIAQKIIPDGQAGNRPAATYGMMHAFDCQPSTRGAPPAESP